MTTTDLINKLKVMHPDATIIFDNDSRCEWVHKVAMGMYSVELKHTTHMSPVLNKNSRDFTKVVILS